MLEYETEDIVIEPSATKRKWRGYYEQLYAYRLDNLEETDQLLKKWK